MTVEELQRIVPGARMEWAIALVNEMPKWGIAKRPREAAFIANVAEETEGLTDFDEDLYYKRIDRVKKIFAKHFGKLPDADVLGYMQEPALFASRVYANRMGNGPEASGDGYRYRGRGPAMLTGRDAYLACEHATGLPLIAQPELLLVPKCGATSACWFWKWKGIAAFADAGDFEGVVRKWNGGTIGLADREHYYGRAQEVLA